MRQSHSRMSNTLKGLGRTEMWQRYFIGGGIKDSVQMGKYTVETQEDGNDVRILFWSANEKYCINTVMDKRDKMAVFDKLEYHPDCTSPEKMKRGEETRDMVDFAFDLMRGVGATHISLMDNSTIPCGRENIHLGNMYFLKYGKTWYETYFDFRPSDEYAEEYAEAKRSRLAKLDVNQLKEQPCEYFTRKKANELLNHIGLGNFNSIEWIKEL